jgi:hypothetical protein
MKPGLHPVQRLAAAASELHILLQAQAHGLAIPFGQHILNVLIIVGPPGAGNTLLGCTLPGILLELSVDDALDVPRISGRRLGQPAQVIRPINP